jgi:hypothetical protein
MKRKIAAMLTQTGFKGFPTRIAEMLSRSRFQGFSSLLLNNFRVQARWFNCKVA